MTFEQAYEYTSKVGKEDSYTKQELEALWMAATELRCGEAAIEIGAQYGRSTSLLLQAAKFTLSDLMVIDPFVDGSQVAVKCMEALAPLNYPFTLFRMTSDRAYLLIPTPAALLHIDGDHQPDSVRYDFTFYNRFVKPGGLIAFHDYGLVRDVVDESIKDWTRAYIAGSCLIVRKP